jgi:hypothetical protein
MTLLSIVGDDISRIVPLLYAYKDSIKKHILLCDDDPSNYQRAKMLQQGMMKFSAKHTLGWYVRVVSINEDLESDIKGVASREREGGLWLNATDGYPAITILLSDFIRKDGGKILSYDHFDNDLHIIEPDGTMSTNTLETVIDIDSYLTLLNYEIVDGLRRDDLIATKDDILELYKSQSLYVKIKRAILDRHFKNHNNFDIMKHKHILYVLQNIGILDDNFTLIPSKQKLLQGDMLEMYLFWLCEELGFDDIMMGVKIDFDDSKNEPMIQNRVVNEFDILMMKNNRIYTIEAKCSNNLDGLEFVYKYDAIIDYFGKTSKAIIVNISSKEKISYLGTKSSSNFRQSTLRRARMAGVAVYHETQINPSKLQKMIGDFFNL